MEIIDYSLQKNNQELTALLNEHHLENSDGPIGKAVEFSFAAFSEGSYLGGISGHKWLNTLHISLLATKPAVRQQGLGTQLLNQAKDFALTNDCRFITINTQDFQARDFYLDYGFAIIAEVADMPFAGTTKYFMLMDLTAVKNT